MTVTYLEKGEPHDFKRVDRVCIVRLERTWEVGGLLYGYIDRFNVRVIAKEDILSID